MAKTLEKVRKEFDVLYAELGEMHQEAASAESDFIQLRTLAKEYAQQAGRAAAELVEKGHAGTCLDDFRGEKAVKNALKAWAEQESNAKGLGTKAKKVVKDFPRTYGKLQAMATELEEEVANRDKKANRKFFKIQSESLPDLKKLLATMKKAIKDLKDTQDRTEGTLSDTAQGFDCTFEDQFNELFKLSAKDRKKEENRKLAHAAKNVRIQVKYLREGRDMHQQIKQLCDEATQAVEDGDSPQKCLNSAVKIYRKMHEMTKLQQEMLGTISANAKKTATGDVKKVIDSANAYLALSKQTLTLLNNTTSASMGAVPSRKGKEKV